MLGGQIFRGGCSKMNSGCPGSRSQHDKFLPLQTTTNGRGRKPGSCGGIAVPFAVQHTRKLGTFAGRQLCKHDGQAFEVLTVFKCAVLRAALFEKRGIRWGFRG